MRILTINYIKFTLIKGLIILLFAWLIYMGNNFLSNNFAYIITGEAFIFGIFLMSINNGQNNLINILPIIISIIQIVVFILILFYYYDYRGYYISNIMIKYWTIFQSVYLIIYFTFIIKNLKMEWSLFVVLIIGTIIISLITIFNETLHGNNSHIYLPLIGFGLYYITTTVLLKNTINKTDNI